MKTVIYCKDGFAVSDFGLKDWIDYFTLAEDGAVFMISSSIAFEMIRLEIARGNIDNNSVIFKFEGETIKIDKRGRIDFWPAGFCDTYEKILAEILNFQN